MESVIEDANLFAILKGYWKVWSCHLMLPISLYDPRKDGMNQLAHQ
jgi:hypothetical protein